MNQFIRVGVGDALSKGVLILVNLYLIRRLSVAEYASLTLLLNAIYLGSQLACGPVERVYIAQHAQYARRLPLLGFALGLFSSFGIAVTFRDAFAPRDFLIVFFGIFILIAYQLRRVSLQQQLRFTAFSSVEVLKNCGWFVLTMIFLEAFELFNAAAAVLALLVATLGCLALLQGLLANRAPADTSSQEGRSWLATIWNIRYVVGYSLIGAAIPYLPVLMATNSASDMLTATYGAALRYQAIIGMAVFALNTVLLPQLAKYAKDDTQRTRIFRELKSAAPKIAVLYLAATVAIWHAIPVVDQGKYPYLPIVFLLLATCPALSFVTTPSINVLLISNHSGAVFAIMCIGLAVTGATYFWTAAAFSNLGPALASISGYASIALLTTLYAAHLDLI